MTFCLGMKVQDGLIGESDETFDKLPAKWTDRVLALLSNHTTRSPRPDRTPGSP